MVVDITEENQRYALECARAAGVSLDYIVSDVLEWQTAPFIRHFDFVLMEYGILHYFVDLSPLAKLIYDILKLGGTLVLHEFHPIIKKCAPKQDGDRWVREGDYFSEEIIEKPAPHAWSAFSQEEVDTFPPRRDRYWQMGEIVSAFCNQNLIIETLVENLTGIFLGYLKRLPWWRENKRPERHFKQPRGGCATIYAERGSGEVRELVCVKYRKPCASLFFSTLE